VIWEADHIKREREDREKRKKALGKLPDDLFEISFFLDTYNFRECGAYSGCGVTFSFLLFRRELESFVDELEVERDRIVRTFADNADGNGSADKDESDTAQ
jgi:hypothetical protein